MSSFSVVVIVGNLARDSQLKYTPSGFPISTFGIAVNTRHKQGDQWIDEANFFDVELFGKVAESLNQYLTKGKLVGIEGELRQDRWEQDGQSRSKVKIIANKVQLLGGNGQGQARSEYGGDQHGKWQDRATGAVSGSARAKAEPAPGEGLFQGDAGDGFSDDIPF